MSGVVHERSESQPRGGASPCPGEGEPGTEPGEVQEVLPEPGWEREKVTAAANFFKTQLF